MAKEATALVKQENKELNVDDKATSLITETGKTIISDSVVAKIASIATREIEGVHSLSARGMSETLMGLAKKVAGTDNRGQGVNVEVGTKEAAVDLNIVVNYGVSIPQIADAVRENIIETVKLMTGLIVKEVNIGITDLYFPEDDEQETEKTSRVV